MFQKIPLTPTEWISSLLSDSFTERQAATNHLQPAVAASEIQDDLIQKDLLPLLTHQVWSARAAAILALQPAFMKDQPDYLLAQTHLLPRLDDTDLTTRSRAGLITVDLIQQAGAHHPLTQTLIDRVSQTDKIGHGIVLDVMNRACQHSPDLASQVIIKLFTQRHQVNQYSLTNFLNTVDSCVVATPSSSAPYALVILNDINLSILPTAADRASAHQKIDKIHQHLRLSHPLHHHVSGAASTPSPRRQGR